MTQTKKPANLFPTSTRTYVIIFIILIIGFFLGAQYQKFEEDGGDDNKAYSQDKDRADSKKQKNNWKTYENNLYKFSVSYPSQWKYKDSTIMANNRYALFAISEESEKDEPAKNSLLILQPIAGKTMLKKWIENTKNTAYVPDFTNSQIEYDDDGEEAIIKKCESSCTYYTYTYSDDQIFTLIINTEDEDDELVEKMVSSLDIE